MPEDPPDSSKQNSSQNPLPSLDKKGINWTHTLVGVAVGVALSAMFILVYTAVLGVDIFKEIDKWEADYRAYQEQIEKESTPSAQEDETADWKTFISKAYTKPNYQSQSNFSIKYPPNWLNTSCEDNPVFFAPTTDLLGRCQAEFEGLVVIGRGVIAEPLVQNLDGLKLIYNSERYDKLNIEKLTISGKKAARVQGTSKLKPLGTKVIAYYIDLGSNGEFMETFSIIYSQKKEWLDYSEEFEQMLSTFKFLD